jgi:outer membrane immunogenic protein
MRSIFSATIGLLAVSAAPALAADLPLKARPMPAIAAVYNWSGCYIGGNVGGKWVRTSGSVDVGPTGTGTGLGAPGSVLFGKADTSTLMGGGQVGCNYQPVGTNWVFGIEGDFDWQRWSRTNIVGGTLPFPFVAGDTFDLRSNWQASARGRIGYAWDRVLLYATGGAAFTNLKVGTNFIATTAGGIAFPATVVSDEKTLVGWTVGGGLEYAFTNNWIAGIEGRYSNYGTTTFNSGLVATVFTPAVVAGGGTFTFAPATQTIKLETFEVMGRLSYKFDFGGPVVARY